MSENNNAVFVRDLHKSFRLPHEQNNGLKQAILNVFRRPSKRRLGYETQHTLKNISFEIKKGEFFGIVGRNGSGKSTLLKLLAGIYTPDSGHVQVNGSLTPFIELGVGFNPELTGKENIYLNGALLGFSRIEISEMYDDIVSFAELESFMDQKLKNYSSGMQVRLAFSIAARAESDILLFDEVLAVGDAAFQQKCYESFAEIKKRGTTIILVTHDMSAVQRFCDRAILIDSGEIALRGDPLDVADQYMEDNFEQSKRSKQKKGAEGDNVSVGVIADVRINKGRSIDIGAPVSFDFNCKMSNKDQEYQIGFQVFRSDGVYVYGTNSSNAGVAEMTGDRHVAISFPQNLAPGSYHITLAIMDKSANSVLRYCPKVAGFNIKQQTKKQGVALLDEKWSIK